MLTRLLGYDIFISNPTILLGIEVILLKISTKGRYGLRALYELGVVYGDKPVSIKSISDNQNISISYLEQIFISLRKAKIIKSQRGAQGGYILSRPPSEITVAEVLDILEGPVEVCECTSDTCMREEGCPTKFIWVKIQDSVNSVIKSITIQDMINSTRGEKNGK